MTEETTGFVAMKKSQCPHIRQTFYMSSVMNIPITHSAITAAVIQPITLSHAGKVKRAITRGLLANLIITVMIGAAITPLMTALQYNARIGSIGTKLMIMPIAVAAARAA
jgi:hypothetical protein